MKTAQKRPFLDTKSAIERARQLETARNLIVGMGDCSPLVLSYLDAGFEQRCGSKDFCTVCCCCVLLLWLLLLLPKDIAHPWTLKGGVKPRQGKPSSVTKTRTQLGASSRLDYGAGIMKSRTRTELGPSLA